MAGKLAQSLRDMETHVRAAFADDSPVEVGAPERGTKTATPVRRTLFGAVRSAVTWLLSLFGFGKR